MPDNTVSTAKEMTYRQLPLALVRIVIGWHFLYEGWTKEGLVSEEKITKFNDPLVSA